MSRQLPGVSGDLFPSRYLTDRLPEDAASLTRAAMGPREAALRSWWKRVEAECGPATGLRALFDVGAMPLMAMLGFRVSAPAFETHAVTARLVPGTGSAVGLIVTRWAARPSRAWRDASSIARELRSPWCVIFAPPFLSIVRARGGVARASVDFLLPDALASESLAALTAVGSARAFAATEAAPPLIESLLESAASFQDRVRQDLQVGVVEALRHLSGVAWASDAFDESLTIVYRILFLLFAESRHLVPHRHPIYQGAYGIGTLCREAISQREARGLWEGLAAISRISRMGCRTDDLIVRPFNGRLFARQAAPSLEQRPTRPRRGDAGVRDTALRHTLTALATRQHPGGREDICYADLGVEQLGAVYERILDVNPRDLTGAAAYSIGSPRRHSDRRKQTGTFYTPQPLAEFLVRQTLGPLVSGRSAEQILELRVVDPAMGSGAFLVAACHYLANAYERALVEEGRCADTDFENDDHADIRRLIAERCLAGVDANPVAVQLAKLSLWLATLARGKPLGFLDHRLRVGNSLVGASPDDLRTIPAASRRSAAPQVLPLFESLEIERSLSHIARSLQGMASTRDDTVDTVKSKERLWTALTRDGSNLAQWRLAAHLWCARWFWPTSSPPSAPELRAALDAIVRRDATLAAAQVDAWLASARTVAGAHEFFHWSLEFADVFFEASGRPRPRAGFDAVIGNPPWEMLRKDHGTDQGRLVRFIRESGLYPSCQRGHMNLYQPFVERALSLTRTGGRAGLVVPWGLAVDDGAAGLRARLFDRANTSTFVGLDNAAGMFPIHRGVRFAVIVASPGGPTREIHARFGVRTTVEIESLSSSSPDEPEPCFPVRLTATAVQTIGGSRRRLPDLRRAIDLELLDQFVRTFPRLGDSSGWGARFGRELNVTEDRRRFGPRGLPVIEGKHVQPFVVHGRNTPFRIERHTARRLMPQRHFERCRLAYRDVAGVGNRVSLIAAIVPADVVTTHTLFCLKTPHSREEQDFLCGVFNSYVLNLVVRLWMGSHVTTSLVEDLPVPRWTSSPLQRRIARLARRLRHGRRPDMHARLQAAVARLYRLNHNTFSSVLESFPLVDRRERDRALERVRFL